MPHKKVPLFNEYHVDGEKFLGYPLIDCFHIASVHKTGEIVLYPMATPNRRLERRQDLIQWLKVQL